MANVVCVLACGDAGHGGLWEDRVKQGCSVGIALRSSSILVDAARVRLLGEVIRQHDEHRNRDQRGDEQTNAVTPHDVEREPITRDGPASPSLRFERELHAR
jgi:hypothetical protein